MSVVAASSSPAGMRLRALRRRDGRPELLRQLPLFRGLGSRALARVAAVTSDDDATAGEVLCREGGYSKQFLLIVEGYAATTCAGEPTMLGPGDFCGEASVIDGGPELRTVTAMTPMRLLVLTPAEFAALTDVPAVGRRLLEAVHRRLRATDAALKASP